MRGIVPSLVGPTSTRMYQIASMVNVTFHRKLVILPPMNWKHCACKPIYVKAVRCEIRERGFAFDHISSPRWTSYAHLLRELNGTKAISHWRGCKMVFIKLLKFYIGLILGIKDVVLVLYDSDITAGLLRQEIENRKRSLASPSFLIRTNSECKISHIKRILELQYKGQRFIIIKLWLNLSL